MKAYDKLTESGYSVGSKPRDGFIEYNTSNPPQELQVLFDAENIAAVITQGEAVVDGLIQGQIERYNNLHGTKFRSVDSCYKFLKKGSYPHYNFCNDIVDYAIEIWEVARAIQEGLIAGIPPNPTEEEFIVLLPAYSGVV